MGNIVGKFCIYDAGEDSWLNEYGSWINHRYRNVYDIPSNYKLQGHTINNGSILDVELDIVPEGTSHVIEVEEYNQQGFNAEDLMLFDSFKEAEEFIMTKQVSQMKLSSVLSVRKIYFTQI